MDADIRAIPGCHPFLAIAIPPMTQLEVVVVAMVVPQTVGEDSTQEEMTQISLVANGHYHVAI